MTDLRFFDLNLLVAFDVLIEERNVTRAAQRIRIGQPAMSHALARLRDLFGDELLVRTANAMQPTPRALELAGPIRTVLADIRRSIWSDRVFRPDVADTTFTIGTTDYAELALLPAVLASIQTRAPQIRLAIRPIERERVSNCLETGAIDLALGHFPESSRGDNSEVLFHEEFDCLYDAEACELDPPLTRETFAGLPHIVMSLCEEATAAIDLELATHGLQRMTLVATPHVLTIPFLLHGLRAVATVPRRLARNCTDIGRLSISPVPVRMSGFDVFMHWHARTDTDPAHQWLRNLVRAAAQSNQEA